MVVDIILMPPRFRTRRSTGGPEVLVPDLLTKLLSDRSTSARLLYVFYLILCSLAPTG